MLPTAALGFELHAPQLPSMQGVLQRQNASVSFNLMKTRCFTGRSACSGGCIAAQVPALISDAARSARSRGRGRVVAATLRHQTVCISSLSGSRTSASSDSSSESADSRAVSSGGGGSISSDNGAAAAGSSAQNNGYGSQNSVLEASGLASNGSGSTNTGSNGAAEVCSQIGVPTAPKKPPRCRDKSHRSI